MSLETIKIEDIKELLYQSQKDKKIAELQIKEVRRLRGDASYRSYYRCQFEGGLRYIVSIGDPEVLRATNSNWIFLQQVFLENGILVPAIYDYNLDVGYVLLEDLGDKTLLDELASIKSAQEERALYEKSLEQLSRIHNINPESYRGSNFTNTFFDKKKLFEEIEMTNEFFIKRYLQHSLTPKEVGLLRKGFEWVVDHITQEKMVVSHRDFHSRNIMLTKKGQYIIDFQDTRMGIFQYDLVSLLEDCYYPVNDQVKDSLKQSYWENVCRKDTDKSEEKFNFLYDLMAIQRVYKAIGSFAFIKFSKGDASYLKYINGSLEKVISFCEKHVELNEFKKCLTKIAYEN